MDIEKFGKNLRKLRTEKQLTQKEFGDKLGVSIQAVSKWELGRCMPDITILQQISKILNVNIDDLLEGNITSSNKKNTKKLLIIVISIMILLLGLGIGIYFYHNHSHSFETKIISTTCEDFTLEGFVAYDNKKTSIYITDVEYCGEKNSEVYEEITCNLYEDYKNTSTLISPCNKKGEITTLDDFLEHVEINVSEYSAACRKFVDSSLSIHITALQKDGKKVLYEIPIAFEDNC